jgi:hypothetical protein
MERRTCACFGLCADNVRWHQTRVPGNLTKVAHLVSPGIICLAKLVRLRRLQEFLQSVISAISATANEYAGNFSPGIPMHATPFFGRGALGVFPDLPLAGATRGFCAATLAFSVASGSGSAAVVAALIFATALGSGRVAGLACVAYQVVALFRGLCILKGIAGESIVKTGAATGSSAVSGIEGAQIVAVGGSTEGDSDAESAAGVWTVPTGEGDGFRRKWIAIRSPSLSPRVTRFPIRPVRLYCLRVTPSVTPDRAGSPVWLVLVGVGDPADERGGKLLGSDHLRIAMGRSIPIWRVTMRNAPPAIPPLCTPSPQRGGGGLRYVPHAEDQPARRAPQVHRSSEPHGAGGRAVPELMSTLSNL